MTLLPLPSLVAWLAVDTAVLPRTLMPSYGLFFSWLYNWKPTPMTRSEWLAPSVSECPSPLGLSLPSREVYRVFIKQTQKKTSNHSNSLSALEQQRERWWGGSLFPLCALEYFIRITKQWYNKRKETKKTSNFPKIVRVKWWDGTSPDHLATTPHSSNPTPGVLF